MLPIPDEQGGDDKHFLDDGCWKALIDNYNDLL